MALDPSAIEEKYRPLLDDLLSDYLSVMKEESGWKQLKDTDGCQFFQQKWKDTKFAVVKSIGKIPFHMDEVWEVVCDLENRPQLEESTKILRILDKMGDDLESIFVSTNRILVVSPRDFVGIVRLYDLDDSDFGRGEKEGGETADSEKKKKKKKLLLFKSVDEGDIDPKESHGVLAEVLVSGVLVEEDPENPEGSAIVTYVVASDPKGWIPTSVVNAALAKNAQFVAHLRDYMVNGSHKKNEIQ